MQLKNEHFYKIVAQKPYFAGKKQMEPQIIEFHYAAEIEYFLHILENIVLINLNSAEKPTGAAYNRILVICH